MSTSIKRSYGSNLLSLTIACPLLICGLSLALSLLNLPLPNTDAVTDPIQRQLIFGFALMALGFGAGFTVMPYSTGKDRMGWFLVLLLLVGLAGMVIGFGTIFGLETHHAQQYLFLSI